MAESTPIVEIFFVQMNILVIFNMPYTYMLMLKGELGENNGHATPAEDIVLQIRIRFQR